MKMFHSINLSSLIKWLGSVIITVKIMGLGIVGIWAFRLSRAIPSNPFKPTKEAKNFVKEILKNSSKSEPRIIYAEGEGFKEAN